MTEWTISTLKELFETRLAAMEQNLTASIALLDSNANHAAEELKKQATEYERRLSDLNHEAARVASANALNVNKEVYDSDQKALDAWRRGMEVLIGGAVPQTEFRSYKDATSTALNIQAGKNEGVRLSGSTIFSIIIALAALVSIIVFLTGGK